MKTTRLGRAHGAWRAAGGVILALLAGCAEQRVLEQSKADLAAGRYEQAVRDYETGVREFPDSPALRGGLVEARERVQSRAIVEAAELRAKGDLDGAQARLERARASDPASDRLAELLAGIVVERRVQADLAGARDLAAKGQVDAALARVDEGLKDSPRHGELLALRRRLENAQRAEQVVAARAVLAETRPVSLDFRDANLRMVLDVVSRTSGVNFVIDRDVRSDTRVTVFLRDARVEDALDLITGTNQLAKKVVDAHTVLIYPNTPEKQRDYQEQVVRVFYLASAEAKGAATFLKSMLKIREPFVDDRSNMLALRDSEDNIRLAERLVSLYDSADPEVLLEMEVLEISATRLTELGVEFPTSFTLTPIPPGTQGLTLGNVKSLTRDNIGLGIGGVTVNLRREVGDFSTLANPRIRVKNKEKAKVLVGDKIPVVTTTTATGGFVSDSVNYLDVGLKLDVEPTVYPDDDVAIRVALEVSSLGTAVKTQSGTLAYQIGTRNANTMLRLHDGETQLLAGLISRDESSDANRLPGLGDLPVLGRLFSSQLDNGQRKELVLAITPHVLRNARAPDASEAELWVGTDAAPKLRPVGGLQASRAPSGPPGGASAAREGAPAGADAAPSRPAAPRIELGGAHDARVGDDLEVNVALASGTGLRGMSLELQFDPKVLQFSDAASGPFFTQGAAAVSRTKSESEPGHVRLGVLRNQASGAVGADTAFTVRFKARAAGETRVNVVEAQGVGVDGPAPDIPMPAAHVVHVR